MTDFETGAVNTEIPEVTEPEEGAVEEVEETESVETEEEIEVTDPDETETTETEELEVTEPTELPEGKKSADSAFAEMRRQNAEMEARLAEYEQAELERERRRDLEQIAEEFGVNLEELEAAVEAEEAEESRWSALVEENQQLKANQAEKEILEMMRDDLVEIQTIDPNIKSLDDLPGYKEYVAGGIRGKKAYFAIKAEQEITKPKPAKAPGQVNKAPQESEYYTSEEIDQMSVEEIQKNLDKVRRSIERF
jgi:hypothetical protein